MISHKEYSEQDIDRLVYRNERAREAILAQIEHHGMVRAESLTASFERFVNRENDFTLWVKVTGNGRPEVRFTADTNEQLGNSIFLVDADLAGMIDRGMKLLEECDAEVEAEQDLV